MRIKKKAKTNGAAYRTAPQESVFNIGLRGVVYREGTTWLAHCLEMDIVAEGVSPQEAMHDLDDLCRFQIETALDEGDLESVFRPAPPEVWKMFCVSDKDFYSRA